MHDVREVCYPIPRTSSHATAPPAHHRVHVLTLRGLDGEDRTPQRAPELGRVDGIMLVSHLGERQLERFVVAAFVRCSHSAVRSTSPAASAVDVATAFSCASTSSAGISMPVASTAFSASTSRTRRCANAPPRCGFFDASSAKCAAKSTARDGMKRRRAGNLEAGTIIDFFKKVLLIKYYY